MFTFTAFRLQVLLVGLSMFSAGAAYERGSFYAMVGYCVIAACWCAALYQYDPKGVK